MNTIYAVYTNEIDVFKVLEIAVKENTENLVIFDYQKEIGTGQYKKLLFNKVNKLKNERGIVVITDEEEKIGSYVEIVSKMEILKIKKEKKRLEAYRRIINGVRESYKYGHNRLC